MISTYKAKLICVLLLPSMCTDKDSYNYIVQIKMTALEKRKLRLILNKSKISLKFFSFIGELRKPGKEIRRNDLQR